MRFLLTDIGAVLCTDECCRSGGRGEIDEICSADPGGELQKGQCSHGENAATHKGRYNARYSANCFAGVAKDRIRKAGKLGDGVISFVILGSKIVWP